MPLTIEFFANGWKSVGLLRPGDPLGSLSNIREDGKRDVYLFECSTDDAQSVIYRSKNGVDIKLADQMRAVISSQFEQIKCLHTGEQPYQMEIRSDACKETHFVRFCHT